MNSNVFPSVTTLDRGLRRSRSEGNAVAATIVQSQLGFRPVPARRSRRQRLRGVTTGQIGFSTFFLLRIQTENITVAHEHIGGIGVGAAVSSSWFPIAPSPSLLRSRRVENCSCPASVVRLVRCDFLFGSLTPWSRPAQNHLPLWFSTFIAECGV